MHRFRITERPCAQLQDSGAPEGFRRKEPFEKKGAITMEGPRKKTREGGAATVDSGFIRKRNRAERPRAIGGRSLLRKRERRRVGKVSRKLCGPQRGICSPRDHRGVRIK